MKIDLVNSLHEDRLCGRDKCNRSSAGSCLVGRRNKWITSFACPHQSRPCTPYVEKMLSSILEKSLHKGYLLLQIIQLQINFVLHISKDVLRHQMFRLQFDSRCAAPTSSIGKYFPLTKRCPFVEEAKVVPSLEEYSRAWSTGPLNDRNIWSSPENPAVSCQNKASSSITMLLVLP